MDVFKFMCSRIFDEEDTDTFEDGSQLHENCKGANKKRKLSDDPLSASNAPLTKEALPRGDNDGNILNKTMKELENLIKSNTIPSPENAEFTYQQVAVPKQIEQFLRQDNLLNQPLQQVAALKEGLQSVRQNILLNQPLQQVAAPKEVQSMRQYILLNQPLQQVAAPKQFGQSVRQDTLLNCQSVQQAALPKQIVQSVQQATLQNQSLQQVAVPKQTIQSMRQDTSPNQRLLHKQIVQSTRQDTILNQSLLHKQIVRSTQQNTPANQSLHQVAIPKQIVQARQQDKLPNQYIRNEVGKVEKGGQQSFETLSWEPRAFLYHNFLSKEECEHLIKLAKPYLQRSLLIDPLTGKGKVSSNRTSFGATLRRGYDEIIRNIEKRIAEATFMPIEHGENLHVLRYEVGQKIEPHYDYFDGLKFNIANGGQRIATFLMYLSPAEEGGETIFPLAKGNITSVPWRDGVSQQIRSGVVVKPKIGDAVLFWSAKPDGTLDRSSLHSGCPVIQGNKWCCTKWMRAKEYKV